MVQRVTIRLLLLIAAIGCGACNDSRAPAGAGCCGADAPTFLHSKIDDDNGDGNPYDDHFPKINLEDDDIADHAWVRDHAGTWHLFFQNEGLYGPSDIEHYTSNDLHSLAYVGVALQPVPGTWDQDGTWAPTIVENGGVYYMFYTGVEGTGDVRKERIGIATSLDLMTWRRLPVNRCPGAVGEGCVYECRECWTTWSGPVEANNQQCRDPFIIWDPENDRWVLFAMTKSTNQYGAVTVAYSTNLVDWTGAGFIDATRRLASGSGGQTTGGMAENPFVMVHDGTNTLLFTDWMDPEDSVSVANPRTIVQYATSTSLDADTLGSVNWEYRGYTPDVGVNSIEVQELQCGFENVWVASESISNPHALYHAEHRRHLILRCIQWNADGSFATSNFSYSGGIHASPRPMAPAAGR